MFRFIFPQDKEISKEVFTLAFPVILSNLSRVLMSMVDVAMVGRLGAEALAATGMGAMLFWGALSLVLGIRTAVQTVASRRLGQKIDHEAGTAFHNGLIMATIYSLPVSLAGWLWASVFYSGCHCYASGCGLYIHCFYQSSFFSLQLCLPGIFHRCGKNQDPHDRHRYQ